MTLPTPLYKLDKFLDVYEPSEDTHLFLDALEKDRDYILKKKPTIACEVGSGSGVLITALASILKNSCSYFSTDVNINACLATKSTALMNNANVEPIGMNLTTMLRCQFDIILFNPPYVVTENEEIKGRGLNRAFAGGENGRIIIDKFLTTLPDYLNKDGVCYLLLLRENKLEQIEERLGEIGFKSEVVLERKIPAEYLYVFKVFQ